jgi:Transcriptional regulatory protein, C terminal
LALLLVNADRTLAVERIVDELWGEDVPETAQKMVQIYVSHLRKLLPSGTMHTRPPGYMLALEPDQLDLNPRRALILAESVEALRESLGLSISMAFWDALLERYLAPARASLGDEYDAIRADGRALPFDDAVALALHDDAPLAPARNAKPGNS